jgi:transposase
MLSVRDLAVRLRVSLSSVQKWCAAGPESGLIPTPVHRFGRQLRWEVADVERFIFERAERGAA